MEPPPHGLTHAALYLSWYLCLIGLSIYSFPSLVITLYVNPRITTQYFHMYPTALWQYEINSTCNNLQTFDNKFSLKTPTLSLYIKIRAITQGVQLHLILFSPHIAQCWFCKLNKTIYTALSRAPLASYKYNRSRPYDYFNYEHICDKRLCVERYRCVWAWRRLVSGDDLNRVGPWVKLVN